jgi:hypothetical protein
MQYRAWTILLAACLLAPQALWAQAAAQPPTPASAPAAEKVAAPAASGADDWFQRAKHPTSWLTWGADLRLRDEYLNNNKTLNKDAPRHEYNYGRFRERIWATVTPVKDLDFNVRLTNEFRVHSAPEGLRDVDFSEIVFDTLNVTWKNILGQPLKAVIGRQDIILGDGWLVLDGTPLDGSRTIYFDAARLTYEHKPSKTTIDAIYIDQAAKEDRWLHPFNHREFVTAESRGSIIERQNLMMEQNERGAILWVANKSIEKTEIDGYFIYKRDEPLTDAGAVNNIYTYGVRGVRDFTENWRGRAELAQQLGNQGSQDICALGFKSMLEYFFRDPHSNSLRVGYEYLSGDHKSTTGKYEGWNPLWGRWPQWSEIYANTIAIDQGKPAMYSNMHRIQFGHTFKPCQPLEILTDYHLLFRNQESALAANPASGIGNGDFRGQLLTWRANYKFNDHIAGHLMAECFFPGNFYTDLRNDPAVFLRYELVFTF